MGFDFNVYFSLLRLIKVINDMHRFKESDLSIELVCSDKQSIHIQPFEKLPLLASRSLCWEYKYIPKSSQIEDFDLNPEILQNP